MTKPTPESIRAALLEQANKGKRDGNSTRTSGDNASYPFWNIPEGQAATVRFLPDADSENMFFWRKREVIKLPFDGVEGGDYPTTNAVTVTVPCVDMFGMSCPIVAATRPWWKDGREALARQYWKKKSYIFQGFVVRSPLNEENVPENPIRRFVINPSIYEIIEKSLMNPEMEDLPTDYTGGRDFNIAKTRKGEYANYSTSQWSFKTRSLNENELIAIEQHGLHDLKAALGRVPDADELEAIKAMFEDSVAGRPFDMASFGKYYRPYGGGRRGNDDADDISSTSSVAAAVSSRMESQTPAASAPVSSKPSANEILERIKNRTNKG